MPKANKEKKIIYILVILWGIIVIGWKILSNLGVVSNSTLMEEIWWVGLLLWGCMILGFVFQPLIKEKFPTSTDLKDHETLIGYYPVVALVVFLGAFIFAPALYGSQTLLEIKSVYFWWAVIGTGILNVFIFYFLTKGLRYGDISLVSVTQSLGPVFALPISFLIFLLLQNRAPISNPNISFWGAVGIFATVIALILDSVMNKKRISNAISVPKNDWLAQHPILCGVLSALFGSIAINFDKVAIDSANPFLMGVLMALIVSIIAFIWTVKSGGLLRIKVIYSNYWKEFLLVGAVYGILILIMNITLVGHNVNYYGAIKRTSLVFSAFYGLYVLHEGVNFREKSTRFLVSIIVFIGIVLIIMKG